MSKGSMWWGNATGKVGQTVLSVLKGQQIARAYQPNVGNPRTEQQTLQRAKFATAVKFYKSATLGSFKFAFENKRPTESDYNAFMRVNKGSNLMINRNGYANPNYPCVYPWKLSEGSLPAVNIASTQGDNGVRLYIGQHDPGITTVQQLARILCEVNGLPGSTIFTFVLVSSGTTDVRDYEVEYPALYQIAQFQDGQVDDTRSLQQFVDELGNGEYSCPDSGVYCEFGIGGMVSALAVIPTLQTANGLRVGASQLQLSSDAAEFMGNCIESGYIAEALTSWGATGKAILQGSLLPTSESGNFITLSPKMLVVDADSNDEFGVSGLPSGAFEKSVAGDVVTFKVDGEQHTAEYVPDDGNYYYHTSSLNVTITITSNTTIDVANDATSAHVYELVSVQIEGVQYVVR